jgi:hypothetical protein
MYVERVSVSENEAAVPSPPRMAFFLIWLIPSTLSMGLGAYSALVLAEMRVSFFILHISIVIQSLLLVGLAYLVLIQFQRQLNLVLRTIDARILSLGTSTREFVQERHASSAVGYSGSYPEETIPFGYDEFQTFHGRQCRFNQDGTVDLDTLVGFRRFHSLEEAEIFIGTERNARQLVDLSR